MKKITSFICLAVLFSVQQKASAQEALPVVNTPQPLAFYKRALVTSISAGPSMAMYSTFRDDGKHIRSGCTRGYIDPLIMELGITDKIGIGFTKGGENYDVNANEFYNAGLPRGSEWMSAGTSYFTADVSYHPFVTKRLDISVFGSLGYYQVDGSCYEEMSTVFGSLGYYQVDGSCYEEMSTYNEQGQMITYGNRKELYTYSGDGAVFRGGVRSRWYFSKRFGLFTMLYGFNGLVKERPQPQPISDSPKPMGYYTHLMGAGLEFGLCMRIFKQKGLPEKSAEERDEERSVTFVWD